MSIGYETILPSSIQFLLAKPPPILFDHDDHDDHDDRGEAERRKMWLSSQTIKTISTG
jgi:hypothetical protein